MREENTVRVQELAKDERRKGYRVSWPGLGSERNYQDFYLEEKKSTVLVRQSDIASSENAPLINDITLEMDASKYPMRYAYKYAKQRAKQLADLVIGWEVEDRIKIARQTKRGDTRDGSAQTPPAEENSGRIEIKGFDEKGGLKKNIFLSSSANAKTTAYSLLGSIDGYERLSERIYYERFEGRFLIRTTGMINLYTEVARSDERTLFIGKAPDDVPYLSETKFFEDIARGFARKEGKEFAQAYKIPFEDIIWEKPMSEQEWTEALKKATGNKKPEKQRSWFIPGLIAGAAAAGGAAYALHHYFS